MEKRRISSFQKALLIVIGLTLIGIGVLLFATSLACAGTGKIMSVEVDVKNDNKFVNVEQGFTTIETRLFTVRAKKVDILILSNQNATIRFDADIEPVDVAVINEKGKIVETYDFSSGRGDIEFLGGKAGSKVRTVVLLSPGGLNEKYANGEERQEFLQKRKERSQTTTKNQIISVILDASVEKAGSHDSAAIVVVKTKVVQPNITNITVEWEDDGDLEVTGDSNLPRYTEIEWKIFDETGITKARRDGEIDFDIDAPIAGVDEDCLLEIWVGRWYRQYPIDLGPLPEAAQGMFIKTKEEMEKLTPKPLPTKVTTPTFTEPEYTVVSTPRPKRQPMATPPPVLMPALKTAMSRIPWVIVGFALTVIIIAIFLKRFLKKRKNLRA